MKNKKDFVYEYSDLNLFQTRVKVLTGEYKGTILDFGGSVLAEQGDKNTFTFEYTLFEKPKKYKNIKLRGDKKFEEFLGLLLVNVIGARKKDKKEHEKLMEAASVQGVQNCKITIDSKFYPSYIPKQQPITKGLQSF